MNVLTKTQEKFLKAAVDAAESWRGTLTGNPDPRPLADFDAEIRVMRNALASVVGQQKALRQLRKKARKFNTNTVYCYVGPEDGGCVDIDVLTLS